MVEIAVSIEEVAVEVSLDVTDPTDKFWVVVEVAELVNISDMVEVVLVLSFILLP